MEYFELPKEELERYNNLSNEDIKNIVRDGLNSEFWKFVRVKLANTLKSVDANLKRRQARTLDQLVELGMLNSIYKTNEELFNMPEMILGVIANQEKSAVKQPQR